MSRPSSMIRLEDLRHYGFGVDIMKTIKVCTHCGAMSSVSQQFCTQCGNRLPSETMFENYQKRHCHCKSCGTVVKNGTHFCPDCGQKLITL